jgi:hypothetical protein
MDKLSIQMEINLVHVQRMNVIQVMYLKVQNIVIVKVICGGDHQILYHIVRKKVVLIEYIELEKI